MIDSFDSFIFLRSFTSPPSEPAAWQLPEGPRIYELYEAFLRFYELVQRSLFLLSGGWVEKTAIIEKTTKKCRRETKLPQRLQLFDGFLVR